MNKISIKWRVTLWYALFMVIVTIAVLSFIFYTTAQMNQSYIKDQLESAVTKSRNEIDYDDGEFDIDNDVEDFEGITISIFDENGGLIYGRSSTRLGNVKFKQDEFQSMENGESTYYVYDQKIEIKDYGNIWIRGVTRLESNIYRNNDILLLAVCVLPFLLVTAVAGGYLLTKRAFLPVKEIVNAVEGINDGNDLTKRIELSGAKDEIYELAKTFDHMFERLQKSFDKEKQFNSDASHELRTPAAVIIAQCEFALTEDRTEEERTEALASIQKQAVRMSTLISRLLTMSRMDNYKQKLQLEEVNLKDLAEIVIEEMEMLAEDKKIRIISDLDSDLIAECDQTLVTRLLINLITNGIKYGRENGEIKVIIKKKEEKIYGTVEDNGIGIAEKELPLIWERFYRVDSARVNNDESYGLGLSMVKWIAKAHGGDVSVKSELGKGSSFSFWF